MDSAAKTSSESSKPGPELGAQTRGTKTTGSDHKHLSRAKYNQSADHVNKTPDTDEIGSSPSTSSQETASNMKELVESDFSQRSDDSGYQSEIYATKCIGHRVGLGSFDLFTELAKVEPGLVRNIVEKVGDEPEDLQRLTEVSSEWQTTLQTAAPKESAIVDRHKKEEQQERKLHKENYPKEKAEKRSVTESETPLTEVQEFGKPQFTSTPKVAAKPASPTDGYHQKFVEVGQKLFKDESLTKCARHGCEAPAKHLFNKQKGQCTSTHCQYEFCTNCRCEFHGGEPCQVLEPKTRTKKKSGIGSRKSKSNLARLGKL